MKINSFVLTVAFLCTIALGAAEPWGSWDFAKHSGGTVCDISGNGNDAMVLGPVKFVPNGFGTKEGMLAEFRKNADTSMNIPGFTGKTDGFSVAVWIYPFHTDAFSQEFGSGWGRFNFHLGENGDIYCGTDVEKRFVPDDLSAMMVPGEWQMFVFTCDGTEGRFFRNGVSVAKKAMPSPDAFNGFRFSPGMDGYLGKVTLWKKSLTDEEAGTLFKSEASRFGVSTVPEQRDTAVADICGSWDFEHVRGKTVLDRSGRLHHAHLRGNARVVEENVNGNPIHVGEIGPEAPGSFPIPSIQGVQKAFTISFWIKLKDVEHYGNEIGNGWNGFNFHTWGDGRFYIGSTVKTRMDPQMFPYRPLENDRWAMLTYTYENGMSSLYLNGTFLFRRENWSARSLTGFRFSDMVNGRFDKIRYWERCLDAREVETLYAADRERFGMPSADAVPDYSTAGYYPENGTLHLKYRYYGDGTPVLLQVEMVDQAGKVHQKGEYSISQTGSLTLPVPDGKGLYWLKVKISSKDKRILQEQEFPFAVTVRLPSLKEMDPEDCFLGVHSADSGMVAFAHLIGIKWVRTWDMSERWEETEGVRGQFDWTYLDRLTKTTRERGQELLYTLHGLPKWASVRNPKPNNVGFFVSWVPDDIADWKNYVTAVAARYRDVIRNYDIVNEGLRSDTPTGHDTGADNLTLLKAAYEAIKAVDPGIRVVGINEHPSAWVLDGKGNKIADGFLEMFRRGALKYMDVLAIHDYNMSSPERYEADYAGMKKRPKDFFAAMKAAGYDKMPIWDTESSFLTPPRINNRPATEEEFRRDFGAKFHDAETACYNGDGAILVAPEHRSAAWEIQTILMQLASGVKRHFVYMHMAATTVPLILEKGVAFAALNKRLGKFRQWEKIAYLKRGDATGVNGVRFADREGHGFAAVWATGLDDGTIVLTSKHPAPMEAEDFLGNKIELPEWKDGILSFSVTPAPVYLLNPPEDLAIAEFMTADSAKMISANSSVSGMLHVFNVKTSPDMFRIESECGKDFSVSGLPDKLRLEAGETKDIPFRIHAGVLSNTDEEASVVLRLKSGENVLAEKKLSLYKFKSPNNLPSVADWNRVKAVPAGEGRNIVVGKQQAAMPEGTYPRWMGKADLSFAVQAAGTQDGFAFRIRVRDGMDKPEVCPDPYRLESTPWNFDNVNLMIRKFDGDVRDPQEFRKPGNAYQIMIRPPMSEKTAPCATLINPIGLSRMENVECSASGRRTAEGYEIEGIVKFRNGLAFRRGDRIAYDVLIDDRDDVRNVRKSQLSLFGCGENIFDVQRWGHFLVKY